MKLQVRYFASVREVLGAGEVVEVQQGTTAGAVRDMLIARGGQYAAALARGKVLRCALGHVLCDENARVEEGGELAFFPPVTGG